MELNVNAIGDTTTVEISGAIDERGAEKLKAAFGSLHLAGQKSICLNFAQATHIGSAGLGKLLLLYQKLSAAGVVLRVERTTADMRQLLTELRLDTLFRVS